MTDIYYVCSKKWANVGAEPFNVPLGTPTAQFSRHRIDSQRTAASQSPWIMTNQFFYMPILNSRYGYAVLHWELARTGLTSLCGLTTGTAKMIY